MSRVIRTMQQNFDIEVMGHTDSNTIGSNTIPRDGWDISSLRAISVVKELIKNKIDPAQLKASGFSSYRPKSDEASENRRVEIRFFSNNDAKDEVEDENFFDRIEE